MPMYHQQPKPPKTNIMTSPNIVDMQVSRFVTPRCSACSRKLCSYLNPAEKCPLCKNNFCRLCAPKWVRFRIQDENTPSDVCIYSETPCRICSECHKEENNKDGKDRVFINHQLSAWEEVWYNTGTYVSASLRYVVVEHIAPVVNAMSDASVNMKRKLVGDTPAPRQVGISAKQ